MSGNIAASDVTWPSGTVFSCHAGCKLAPYAVTAFTAYRHVILSILVGLLSQFFVATSAYAWIPLSGTEYAISCSPGEGGVDFSSFDEAAQAGGTALATFFTGQYGFTVQFEGTGTISHLRDPYFTVDNVYGPAVVETWGFYPILTGSGYGYLGPIAWCQVTKVDPPCPTAEILGFLLPGTCAPSSPSYTIKLTRADGTTHDQTNIVSVKPGETTTLLARVYDQNNQSVPNIDVQLSLKASQNSGGHNHGDDTVIARTGTVNGQQTITGKTDSPGFQFEYGAPGPAGDIAIKATCANCTQQGPNTIWVGIKDLQLLQADPSYVLITPNADQNHPSNHYVTGRAQEKIQGLATDYHELFPNNPLLYLNDSSLIRGGVFDLAANWSSQPRGHSTHQRGTDIDVMANEFYHDPAKSIPSYNYVDLMNVVAPENGCNAQIHSGATPNEHFHLYCR